MTSAHLTALILEYRYWILVPLSMAEGPIVAFIAGTLAAAGYFDIYILVPFFFVRDMVMDAGYYALGHYGGRTRLAQKLLKKIGVTPDHLESVRVLWEKRAGTTMFIGKTSYGISTSFIVVAGMVGMPLAKFFGWGAVVALCTYIVLLFLGYFFGNVLGGKIEFIIGNIEYAILGLSIFVAAYFAFSIYMSRKLMREQKKEAMREQ